MSGSHPAADLPILSTRARVGALLTVAAFAAVLAYATFDVPSILFVLLALAALAAGARAWGLHRDLLEREAALERSEARYRTLFERNVIGVALADADSRCLEANVSLARMLGFDDPRGLEGEPLEALLGGALPPPGVVQEAGIVRRDGTRGRLIYCWGRLDEGEGAPAMLLSAVDVTEEHRTRERLKAVVHTVEEGVLTIDRRGRIRFANPAARAILQLQEGDIGSVGAFGPRWELFTLEGERLGAEENPASRVLRRGIPVRDETLVLRRPEGTPSILRVSAVSLEGFPVLESEVVVTLRDVTDEVEEVRTLEESERVHRSVVNYVGQVLFRTDRSRRITFLNPAWEELTGRSVEASLGTDILDSFAPEDRALCRAELRALLFGRSLYCRHEARILGRRGRLRWVEVRAQLVAEKEPDERGVIGLLTDVTERRENEERVARARRMEAMGQLAGGVAHDFNNLLTVILGYAQLIQAEAEDSPALPPAVRDSAREILRTGQKAASITRQLLTFSRQQILDRRVLDPNQIIRRYEHFLRRFLPASIACEIRLEPNPEWVEISPTHLEQALLNLVINARDALEREPGGKMTVSTRNETIADPGRSAELGLPQGRYVAIEVADTGCGMDPDTLERIFEPFFSTKPKEKGSGMGLAAVYGIVNQAGGAVDVHSALGEGSVFTIYLPAAAPGT